MQNYVTIGPHNLDPVEYKDVVSIYTYLSFTLS